MKHTLTLLCALMSFVAAVAQTQHSIIIDEQSFKAVQVDPRTGVGIDKIPHDNSNRPCARIKMHVNRMTRAEIDGLKVHPVGGSVVVMKQTVAAEGNGLIIELTAKEPTRFYLHHDKYGDSNEVSLNLEGNKEYTISASLNVTHSIVVNANVSRADVYLDGIYQGETNDDYTLTITNVTPGAHTIKVQQGSAVTEQNVDVSAENIFFRIVVNAANSHPQYVILEVIPKSAVVIIDNKNYVPDEYGNVQLRLRNGSYTYQVSAKDYHTEKGMFVVSGAKIDKRIELLPAFGWLSVAANGTLQGANIFVDDNLIGKTPITRYQLSSGKHHIRVVRDMYLPGEEIITIEDNKLFEYSTTLVADFATVTLSAEEDCDIYVNDVYKGKSPWSGTLATGAYLFEARKEGHRSTTLSQTIVATQAKQSYTLNPPTPIVGMLNITSTPARANVYIDDKLVGQTPMMCDVLIGKHKLSLRKDEYKDAVHYITIEEGRDLDLNIALLSNQSKSTTQKSSANTKPASTTANQGADSKINGYQSIVQADADMHFGMNEAIYIGVDYVGGYRFNRAFYLGLGLGFNAAVAHYESSPDVLGEGKVYPLGKYKLPLYLYAREYLGKNKKVQPFFGLAAGLNINIPVNRYVADGLSINMCRFFGELEFGLNISPKSRKSLFFSVSCPLFCTPKYVSTSETTGSIVNKANIGLSFKLGTSF